MIPEAPLGDILRWLHRRLSPNSDTPGLDAQVLLSHALERPRSWVLAHPEARLSPNQRELLETAVARLDQGDPLPYVIGQWEFYGLNFHITLDTLIPRPETELLVEKALAWLEAHPSCRLAADVGTGSGCIAITLARQVSELRILASDSSLPALRVARQNAGLHSVSNRIYFLNADLLRSVRARFDLICANLPYIPTAKLRNLEVFGKEPDLALDGGPDGLVNIRELLTDAPRYLAPGGLLLLEIERSQGEAVSELARRAFPEALVGVFRDLAGRDRLVSIQARSGGYQGKGS